RSPRTQMPGTRTRRPTPRTLGLSPRTMRPHDTTVRMSHEVRLRARHLHRGSRHPRQGPGQGHGRGRSRGRGHRPRRHRRALRLPLLPGVRFACLELGTGIGVGDAALVRRQRSLLRSFDAEVVHAHGFRAGLITLRTLRTRLRFVLSLHNRASGQGLRAKVETRVETMLARGADLVLGASTDLVDRAKDLGADNARFLPAAAPQVEPVSAEAAAAARARLAAEYGFDEGAVIVLAVGRVARQKNYPMLVRALGRLREAGDAESALVVLIAGAADDAVLAEVRTQYEQLGPASALPALHFLGARDDIAELAATADVYVLTSVWE